MTLGFTVFSFDAYWVFGYLMTLSTSKRSLNLLRLYTAYLGFSYCILPVVKSFAKVETT